MGQNYGGKEDTTLRSWQANGTEWVWDPGTGSSPTAARIESSLPVGRSLSQRNALTPNMTCTREMGQVPGVVVGMGSDEIYASGPTRHGKESIHQLIIGAKSMLVSKEFNLARQPKQGKGTRK